MRGSSRAGKEVKSMKEGIHPEYKECKVTCACGNSFITKSTKEEIRLVFAHSATHSLQDSRNSSTEAEESKNSRISTRLTNLCKVYLIRSTNLNKRQKYRENSRYFLFLIKLKVPQPCQALQESRTILIPPYFCSSDAILAKAAA